MLLIKVRTNFYQLEYLLLALVISRNIYHFLDPGKYLIEYYQILYSMSRYWIMELTSFFNIKSKNGKKYYI